MLTNKQVNYLHQEQNRIMSVAQKLREMADTIETDNYFFGAKCYEAADALEDGCMMIDDVLLEGSTESD